MSSVPFDRLTSYALRVRQTIAEDGYGVVPVVGWSIAPYSYTVGLHETHGFELVMVGLDHRVMDGLLRSLVERFRDSAGPDPSVALEGLLAEGFRLIMRPVRSLEPFSLFRTFYGMAASPPFWQAVWPDAGGQFPGDAGYSPPLEQQQLP